ncbi:MAG TPA: spore germination protein [Bacillales bacterium]|nr:spore germination protein [Bacillales bacterium]
MRRKFLQKKPKPMSLKTPRDWDTALNQPLSSDLQQNMEILKQLYANTLDVVFRSFQIAGSHSAKLVYLDNMADVARIDDQVLKPLMETQDITEKQLASVIEQYLPVASIQTLQTFEDCIREISSGNAILLVDKNDEATKIGLSQREKRQIKEPENEPVIRGPKEGFIESLPVNLSLIRQMIRAPQLKMKSLTVGTYTKTEIAAVYMETIADHTLVEEVMNRLKRIRIDGVLESGYIEEFIEDNPYSPFPQTKISERVDVAASSLLEGRVVILVNGSPTALVVPASLTSLIQAADDYYNRFLFGSSFRILRFTSFFVSLFLPGFYVAVISFHQEMVPTDLLISIAASREAIPFPTLVEAIIMQLAFEVLREAGLRLPRQVGSAVTIVGALVIGQAAVSAGFVSATMVIIIAVTGITSFTAPHYPLESAIRILRFVLMFLAGTLGLLGLVFGMLAIFIHLCTLRSFGVPYLAPMAPAQKGEWEDTMVRAPWWKKTKRPHFTGEWNKYRVPPGQKPGPGKEGDDQ